jgi:hypothetical protein
MIESDELLIRLCGADRVASFKEVMLTSMRLARVVKQVVAIELDGALPATGKQFLTTPRGVWRLAARANSDNSTEARAHRRLGAKSVQVFGELTPYRREQGWITLEELYGLHDVKFDPERLLGKVAERLRPVA